MGRTGRGTVENGEARKGQFFSFDAIIASIIFILALVSLLSYWHSVRETLSFQSGDMLKEAIRISDELLLAEFPEGTDCDVPENQKVGFAITNSKKLSQEKIDCTAGLSQDTLKRKFATGYNISIFINDRVVVGSDINSIIGNDPSSVKNVGRIRRVASVFDETSGKDYIAVIDVYVYN